MTNFGVRVAWDRRIRPCLECRSMRGIISAGGYIPYRRLQRAEIAKTFGSGGGRGTRSVASYDEDTTTMGVEAARFALKGTNERPESLWFSTASPAYLDKNNASTVHAALRLDSDVAGFDFGGALRSGRRRAARRPRRARHHTVGRGRPARRAADEWRRGARWRRRRRGRDRRRARDRRIPRRRERDGRVHRALAHARFAPLARVGRALRRNQVRPAGHRRMEPRR